MNYSNALPGSNGNSGGKPPGGLDGWDDIQPAEQPDPVPPGAYIAEAEHGELSQTRSGGDAYKIRYKILEGPHAGRVLYKTYCLYGKAAQYSKRDLIPFDLGTVAQMLSPFPGPKVYKCKLWVALQQGDSGAKYNDVKRVQILEVTTSPVAEYLIDEGENQ